MDQQLWRELIDATRPGVGQAATRAVLRAAGGPYRLGVALRNRYYDLCPGSVASLPVPVISIGNLAVGGSGKTPMAGWVAALLHAMGRKPAVLLRGYRRSHAGGRSDEAVMLERQLGDRAAVLVGPDRVARGREAVERHQSDVLVLDDGFQHRRVCRDLNVLLLDATCPPGRLRLLPRGVLREPFAAVRRADLVVLTRTEQVDDEVLADWRRRVRRLGGTPILHARTVVDDLVDSSGRSVGDRPGEIKLLAFCGIGNPVAFETTLRQWGSDPIAARRFDDHHPYTAADLDSLVRQAKDGGADALVTTEKDVVRLAALPAAQSLPLPVYSLRISLSLGRDEAEFVRQLRAALARGDARAD